MIFRIDKWLVFAVILLLFFSVWMMSSVSVFDSVKKERYSAGQNYCISLSPNYSELSSTEKQQYLNKCIKTKITQDNIDLYCEYNNCNDRYFLKHIRNIFIALIGMIIMFFIPLNFLKITSPLWFIIGFLLLLTVLIMPAQGDFTAKSWISIPLFGLFQPSELMKLALSLYTALWMEKKRDQIKTLTSGFLPYFLLVSIVVFPIILQPDFGTTIIMLAIASSMFWIAGGKFMHFIYALTSLGGIAYTIYSLSPNDYYLRKRIDTFLDPQSASAKDLHQLDQSYLSLGNGGLFGSVDSTQSFGYLPEIKGDMIFASIGEKVGFIGIVVVIGLYIFITLRGFFISIKAPDRFSMLVGVGITSWFASQSLVNMMVVTGLFPLTGITLPLLSYGGTSMLITLTGIGILLRISIHINEKSNKNTNDRGRKRRTHFSSYNYRR
jgi:cell division protein FtsW